MPSAPASASTSLPRFDEPSAPLAELRLALAAMARHWLGMLVCVALGLALALAATMLMPRIYEARGSLQIDQMPSKVTGTEDAEREAGLMDEDRFLQTQADVLGSRALAQAVAARLGLARNADFLRALPAPADFGTNDAEHMAAVVDGLQKYLVVSLPRNSRIVTISFRARDPQLAADIVNAFCHDYLAWNYTRKNNSSAYSTKFLETRLEGAKAKLEASERALIAYARSEHLIDASAGAMAQGTIEGPRSLVTANLVELNRSYAQAQAERLRAEQHWQQAAKAPVMSLPEVLGNDAMVDLLQKRADLRAEIAQQREHLKPDHPKLLQAEQRLAEQERQISALAGNIRHAIQNEYLTALHQEAAVAGKVGALKSDTLSEQDRGVRYTILKREVDTNRQLYESLLARYKVLSAQAGAASDNISQLDTALPPRKPASPRRLLNLALGLLGGLSLAGLYALGRMMLAPAAPPRKPQPAPITPPEITPAQTAPAAIMPASAPNLPQLAGLWHGWEQQAGAELRQLLIVASGQNGQGQLAPDLAQMLASHSRAGRHGPVLLIDANLRQSAPQTLLGLPQPSHGLADALAGHVPVRSCLWGTGLAGISILPAGQQATGPQGLRADHLAYLEAMLADLSRTYATILVQGPPLATPEALADNQLLASVLQASLVHGAIHDSGGPALPRLPHMLGWLAPDLKWHRIPHGW